MGEPVRLQLSRGRGFNLQRLSMETNGLPAVNVARPSRWGNPFKVGDPHPYALPEQIATEEGRREFAMDAFTCVACYELSIATARLLTAADPPLFPELSGKNLACWCADGPCHADVLLRLSNPPASS